MSKCPNCDFSGWVTAPNGDYVLGDASGMTVATVSSRNGAYLFGWWASRPNFGKSPDPGYTTKEAAMAAAEAYLESVRKP